MNFKKLSGSFRHALAGLGTVFKEEQNFRIIVVFGIIVLILALFLNIVLWQLVILILVIFSLVILELINTVVEKLVDVVHPRLHHYAATIKDIMAGAVLVASVVTLLIVFLILGTHIIQ